MNPIPMLLHCPMCGKRHVDRGEFATKPHHTHSCQKCGHCWRPAVVHTVGVRFLPGFKDGEVVAVDLPPPPGVKPMTGLDVLRCSATSTGFGEERRCQLAHQHEGEHVSGTWSWRVDPDIRISCRMCLDEHESFIPMDRAKGKAPCPRCNQNLADVIVLDELSTKTGFRTCLHARGQGTADTCVEPEGHPGMHSNGSGGFWAKGA